MGEIGDYTTPSGLVVADRRHSRSLIQRDPRSDEPNDNGPGPNVPPVSVGPTSSTNAPGNFVMSPPAVQAWSGWPDGWVPSWGPQSCNLIDLMAKVSTVFGAIDLNASILSTMPPYRVRRGEVVASLPWMANPQPEVYTGWTEAIKQVVTSYMGGEAFIWATSRENDDPAGAVRTWVMLNPAWVDVEMDGQLRRYHMGGVDITADVLHLRYSSWPGDPHGHGPLEALAQSLFGAAALERYQANLAVRGGIPWGALTAPGNLSANQAETMRDNFVASRLSAMGAPAVLSGGVTLTPLTISPKDMALLELRQFDEARIAVLLGVPPTLLGLPSGADSLTYNTTAAIYDYHWRSSLRPKAQTIFEGFSHWALPPDEFVEVNRDEYVRPAFNERVTAWSQLHAIVDPVTGQRAVTVEEIREAERLGGAVTPPTAGAGPNG